MYSVELRSFLILGLNSEIDDWSPEDILGLCWSVSSDGS